MTWKKFDKLFFMGPASLGDSFVMNGIIHHFADRCVEFHLPINSSFEETLTELYSEHSNIITVPFPPDPSTYALEDIYCSNRKISRVLRPPIYGDKDNAGVFTPFLWDQQLYTFFELPYELKYTNFRLPKISENAKKLYSQLNPNNEPFALYHTGTFNRPEGLPINKNPLENILRIDLAKGYSNNMLDYIPLILNATVIHCVSSAFFNLVDCIHKLVPGRLFFHDIRRSVAMNISNPWNNGRWHIIKYKERLE